MPDRRFRKGESVKFRLPTRWVLGVVREDRGPIGMHGRHLYLVEFRSEPDSEAPALIELPAEQLELVQDAVSM